MSADDYGNEINTPHPVNGTGPLARLGARETYLLTALADQSEIIVAFRAHIAELERWAYKMPTPPEVGIPLQMWLQEYIVKWMHDRPPVEEAQP